MLGRVIRITLALVLLATTYALVDGWRELGHRPDAARRARMERSPEFKDGHFENPQPLHNDFVGSFTGMMHASPYTRPSSPLQIPRIDPARFRVAPPSGLRVTWFGHSTTIVEIDGHRILTDPVWTDRVSPIDGVGPTRFYPPPIAISDLPRFDAVVVSHDHYDHLDYETIRAMKDWDTRFVVPLGVGAHLAYWGVPEARITEVDWWDRVPIGDLTIVCTPARHASGRHVLDKDATLWAGYALVGAKHRVYYSGDTGLFPAMNDIGEKLGPFDLTMIETGQYNAAWPDWHIGPEQAVRAHAMVRGKVLLPVHWALLALAYHGWTEPVERASAAATRAGALIVTPRPGQSFEPTETTAATTLGERWWPEVPWRSGDLDPIVSTQVPNAPADRPL